MRYKCETLQSRLTRRPGQESVNANAVIPWDATVGRNAVRPGWKHDMFQVIAQSLLNSAAILALYVLFLDDAKQLRPQRIPTCLYQTQNTNYSHIACRYCVL